MRNDGHKVITGREEMVPRPIRGSNGGILPNSFKALSSYLRIVSSGASTVASTVRSAASAASSMVEKEAESCHDLVCWAGFNKIELERGTTRQILLLGLSYGFQIWDVEEADNVRNLVTRHDGPVSFIQFAPKPAGPDKFSETRPLLVICADGSFSESINFQDLRGNFPNVPQRPEDGTFLPTVVWFYSLKTQSYVDLLRFRSAVHLVRCSPRIVAVLQSAKINCFNAATLEIDCVIDTNPIPTTGGYGSGITGFGPLALGPRWLAYSGSQVSTSGSGRVSPQNLTSSASFPSNGSLFAHLAKESGKQIAAGFVTLGDKGYKKLSRYYSDLLPDSTSSHSKAHGIIMPNGTSPDRESVGMVIVRDVVSQSVVAQFKAHKSPILSLCFDPSGMLLVTASVHGHNINIFLIMPGSSRGSSGGSSSVPSYVHLYRLQRGFTNAVIQDISFSSDSQWILISSSRGTSHLFAISPTGEPVGSREPATGVRVLSEQMVSASSSPVALNAVSRIRNGGNILVTAVTGAAAAATGRSSHHPIYGTIASVFHNCSGGECLEDRVGLKKEYYLLVYSPSGSVIQYVLRTRPAADVAKDYESDPDERVVVDAIKKWNICQKQNRVTCEDFANLYSDISGRKIYPDGIERESNGNHLFISEAEIHLQKKQSHQLWAKTEVYLYAVPNDALVLDEEIDGKGEVEIENFPVGMVESRSMGFHRAPRFQQGRFGARISSDSLSLATDGGMLSANESNESPEEEKGHDGLQWLHETGNSSTRDSNDAQSTRLDAIIYTREDHMGDNQIKSVNNIDGPMGKFAESG